MSAFTLMEMLAVVTVIVVLAALLIPVLSMVKNASVRISCANNIRSISLASLAYAQGEVKVSALHESVCMGGSLPND